MFTFSFSRLHSHLPKPEGASLPLLLLSVHIFYQLAEADRSCTAIKRNSW